MVIDVLLRRSRLESEKMGDVSIGGWLTACFDVVLEA
jgi:hypothetical protein